jgi:hypothetical protein
MLGLLLSRSTRPKEKPLSPRTEEGRVLVVRGSVIACWRLDGIIEQVIRSVRGEDLPRLRDLEWAAGAIFRDLGVDAIADDEPLSIGVLAAFQSAGRAWVFVDHLDRPVAYLLVEAIDAAAHIEQVSVHPESARRGLRIGPPYGSRRETKFD